MRKHLLFAILFSAFGLSLNAQLASGTVFSGNVTGDDVVTGDKIDVQAWLQDGKSVVIDVFATWCGPCWSFHATGWLEDMMHRYGPEGTDQIRVVGVEADGSTPVSGIMTNQFGLPGSWVTNPNTLEPINYPIIDSPAAATALSIAYFPTLYIIRPDGTVVEIGNNRYNEEYWIAAMGINPGPNAFVNATLPTSSFCESTTMDPTSVQFENVGDAPITSATVNVYGNGVMLESVQYNGPEVGIFQTGSVDISAQTFNETTEISAGIVEVNGSTDVMDMVSSTVVRPDLLTEDFVFEFTTDYYALEASFIIQDDLGNVLASDSYEGGPDSFGGGGPDANKTFEYPLTTDTDVSCLTIIINDSYGDGFIFWDPDTQPEPGFGVKDAYGNVVKEAAEGRFRFVNVEGNVNTANTSALPELDELASSKIYPNPVVNDLNVELNFSENIDFRLTLVNAYGQIVKDLGNQNGNTFARTIDVSDLSAGMYLVSVVSEEGQRTFKFNKL